ncbi:acetate kinase [Campylobacter sp. FMV-PI01]|uniref:Acetate kinase n=1 Tax=Campylobacter portucalensis TaxID=2608384 RepID=A0A6L5WLC1_9BACT|nr:acetate kinase [Campylobacter portucalensis]MSN96805.1 acetate kinase [Campylobacter portucalensis]
MKILVLNSGSSSIKFKLYNMDDKSVLASGIIEEIGNKNSKAILKFSGKVVTKNLEIINHEAGTHILNQMLKDNGILDSLNDLDGIGHRIVHGGDKFKSSVIIDDEVIDIIKYLSPLAPLHNPAHLEGIKSAIKEAPNVPNVAVFDTVFHQTMPNYAYMYAIPYDLYKNYHVRKYGFHGTSHKYVSQEAAKFLNIDINKFNAISLHIGNGASITAIKNGKSIDTSMGITPLEGLMMGTRSGDIDPAAITYLAEVLDVRSKEIYKILNNKSGLLGICGTNDMREVRKMITQDNELAKLAYSMYMYRIIKYIGSYFAVLGRVDALIFTAGVGENDFELRDDICNKITHLGVLINKELNQKQSSDIRFITKENSPIKALVVPTDEELAIALDVKNLILKK